MSKFQDLLEGKIPMYSGAIIVPVEDAFTVIDQSKPDEKYQWKDITCPRLAHDGEVIAFSKIPNGYIAVGYPFFDGTGYRWKVRG